MSLTHIHTHIQITPARKWTVSSLANRSPVMGGSQGNKSLQGIGCLAGVHGRVQMAD